MRNILLLYITPLLYLDYQLFLQSQQRKLSASIIQTAHAEIKLGCADKFHKPHSWSRAVPCGHSDRRTDTTKLIVAFCNWFANAPKNRLNTMWKWPWSNLGYYSESLLEGLRKTINNLSCDSVLATNGNTCHSSMNENIIML